MTRSSGYSSRSGEQRQGGLLGISYPGFYTSAGIINAHPALVAASPQAPITDLYMGDDAFHNGAFFLAANFGFYASFQSRTIRQKPKRGQRIRIRHGRRLQVLSEDGPGCECGREVSSNIRIRIGRT